MADQPYWLLPFRFGRLDARAGTYVATNLAGQYIILTQAELQALIRKELESDSPLFKSLKSRHFVLDASSQAAIELLAAKYRTRQAHLPELAGLHIMVLTLRCTNNCTYCQVSKRGIGDSSYDMSAASAEQALEFMFSSPSRYLKLEFQGGEPLLRFDLIREITSRARERAQLEGRSLDVVICTNLALLDDAVLSFCRTNDVHISTSLDGPEWLHNSNRPSADGRDYQGVIEAIRRCQLELGMDRVSALMTTTRRSLDVPKEIVNEYLAQDLHSIFLRPLNPYGLAAKEVKALAYDTQEWLAFYKRAMEYILTINKAGVFFREEYAAILLKRILTHSNHGFVDLQSPTGAFSAAVVYNYDGGIYPSDEARMLAEMGDQTFRLGELGEATYGELIANEQVLELLYDTMTEGMPMCSDCPYQPYCGSDPVRHHRLQGDSVGHKAFSSFCRKQQGVFSYLIGLLEDSPQDRRVLLRWVC